MLAKFIPQQAFKSFVRRNATAASVGPFTQIEARWTKLPEAEQGAIADRLAELQKGDWKKMTLEEKRAAYFIAYGAHGARAPHDNTLNYRVAGWVTGFLVLAGALFTFGQTLKPKLITVTDEWKAAEAQLAIERKQNPFRGPYEQHLKEEKLKSQKE